jgi:aryl-alcohol dehydrogenase-like predicted oxidoreductase
LAQLCLAWLLARGQDIGPVAGTRHRTYLEDNLKALQVTLSPNDMAQIDEAAPFGAALGLHCPVVAMQAVNR